MLIYTIIQREEIMVETETIGLDLSRSVSRHVAYVHHPNGAVCVACKSKYKKGDEVVQNGQYIVHEYCKDILILAPN